VQVWNFDFEKVQNLTMDHKFKFGEKREVKLNSISPSGVTRCLREQFLGTFKQEQNTYSSQRIFDFGDLVHDDYVAPILQYYADNLADENTFIFNEARLQYYIGEYKFTDDGIPIHDIVSGYIDNLIIQRIPSDNITGFKEVFTPIEIKSIKARSFNKLRQPKFDHLVQIAIYMYCVDADYGIVVYLAKDDKLTSKTYIIYRNEDEFKTLDNQFRKLYLDVDTTAKEFIKRGATSNYNKKMGIIPPAEFRISNKTKLYKEYIKSNMITGCKEDYEKEYGWECTKYCNFKDECLSLGLKGFIG
jgi:hypothetical protein